MIFDGLNEVYWEGLWTLEKWLSRIWSEGARGEAILTLPAGTVPFFLYSTNQSGVYFGNRSFRVVPAFRGLKHYTEFESCEDPRFTTSLITQTKKHLFYFQDFGMADHELSVSLLKKKYPDHTIIHIDESWITEEGFVLRVAQRETYSNALNVFHCNNVIQ